ncbi:hypothetical protein M9Y10_041831 [Tritrichomonas musculus]|uniref:BTB domain-containing protein n=1 Tax=Tritrichomonas musculus TaxID=1915356 RepID=A0ABR2K6B9_9EUKA
MSEEISSITIKPRIRCDKNFVYKGKKYPIDFSLIQNNSNYFYDNRMKYIDSEDIELDETIELTDDVIQSFINCCHIEPFQITNSNLFSLNYLSCKYEVPELTKYTQNYISSNDKSLVFQSLEFKKKFDPNKSYPDLNLDTILDTSKEEEIISDNFDGYFNDDRLLSLSIPVIDRIIKKRLKSIQENQDFEKMTQITDFLFKCLDHFNINASILFLNVDFDNQPSELVVKLITEYSGKFDFSMINSKSLVKTTSQLISEVSKLKFDYNSKLAELNQIIENQRNDIQNFMDAKNAVETELRRISQENVNLRNDQTRIANQQNERFEALENQIRDFITGKNEMNERLNQQNGKFNAFERQINDLVTGKNEMNGRLNQQNGRFESLENQIRDLVTGKNEMNGRLNQQNGRFESLERQIRDLVTGKNEMNERLNQQDRKQQTLSNSIDNINNMNQKFATREISIKFLNQISCLF